MVHTVEILSSYSGAVHRMKLEPLIRQKLGGLEFCRLGEGNERTTAVLINSLFFDPDTEANEAALLRERAKHAVIMLFIPDINAKLIPVLKKLSKLVDVFLVATPEMQKLVRLFTEQPVEVLFDPIDFGFSDSFAKSAESKGVQKIVWFGYWDSYQKSMRAHEHVLIDLHVKKEIEYHIVTKHTHAGELPGCILHQYAPETFPALLQGFDACVASHVPVDLDINTTCKSENKAVLAINRGVPVIASRTAAYERLLAGCGLEEYLFTSNEQMVDAIRKLRPAKEKKRYLKLSQTRILENYSSEKMVSDWLDIYERARQQKFKAERQLA